jgi:hypothetical protein
MNKQTNSTPAFSLVEVALALGVAAFCLIAILGLLPAGLNTNQTSTRQTTANGILSSIVADLRGTTTGAQSSLFQIPFTGTTRLCCDGNGACSLTSSGSSGGGDNDEQGSGGSGGNQCANAIFVVKVKVPTQGDDSTDSSVNTTTADVTVSWPYSAAGAGGSDNDSGSGGDSDEAGSGSSAAGGGNVETFVTLAPGVTSGGSGDGGD